MGSRRPQPAASSGKPASPRRTALPSPGHGVVAISTEACMFQRTRSGTSPAGSTTTVNTTSPWRSSPKAAIRATRPAIGGAGEAVQRHRRRHRADVDRRDLVLGEVGRLERPAAVARDPDQRLPGRPRRRRPSTVTSATVPAIGAVIVSRSRRPAPRRGGRGCAASSAAAAFTAAAAPSRPRALRRSRPGAAVDLGIRLPLPGRGRAARQLVAARTGRRHGRGRPVDLGRRLGVVATRLLRPRGRRVERRPGRCHLGLGRRRVELHEHVTGCDAVALGDGHAGDRARRRGRRPPPVSPARPAPRRRPGPADGHGRRRRRGRPRAVRAASRPRARRPPRSRPRRPRLPTIQRRIEPSSFIPEDLPDGDPRRPPGGAEAAEHGEER